MRDWADNLKKTPEEFFEYLRVQGYESNMVKEAEEALLPPHMPEKTIIIWNFIYQELHRASRYLATMEKPIFQYLDKSYLREEMKDSLGMDFNKYSFIIPYFENAIIENHK